MIRFIHAADAHIDSPLKGLEMHDGAPVDVLRGATRRAFENLIQLAIDENIDFLVIAGDLYDGDWKDYSSGLFFRRQMACLCDKGIPVYLIAGNHDAASVISRKLSLPKNVHVFSTRLTESREVAGHPMVIHGRGFSNRAVPENLVLDYPAAVPGKFNMGLLHTSLTGRPGHDTYAPCSETDLRQKGYGYWALGHIHQPEVISRDPWIVFAGNCQGRDAREAGPHGCWLVTVNDSLDVERVDWHDLDVVRWRVLEIDLAGVAEESEALDRAAQSMTHAVSEAEGRLLAARIVFTGATPLHGSLHRDSHRWRAELLARSQDLGQDVVWIEQIKVSTSPVYDLAQLAERDALTGIVLETLEHASIEPGNLPEEIKEMLGVLPGEIRSEVESDWMGEGSLAVREEVRAIILDALGTKGGQGT
ncbi:MAG: DNA repair exonuclease [Deltaproteobacteria bacterium]|nr:DNA repair exonuclease [Deltaproteobacteria bacterium]